MPTGIPTNPKIKAEVIAKIRDEGMRVVEVSEIYGINPNRFNTIEEFYEAIAGVIYYYNHKRIHDVLHADETTLQVLREPGKTAQSKSYMWLYRTSGDTEHPVVLYDYQPSRKAEHPARFLEGWRGYLHADGYEGYHRLPDDMAVVGCWAHLRRKFDEAQKNVPTEAREDSLAFVGKRYCDKLFEMERDFADLSPERRCEKRMEISKPLMEAFFAWTDSCGAVPKLPVGKAVHYAQSQRKYLERYLLDGRLEISNNRAERSIKPFVIGRKNWLFANTPQRR